VFIHHSLDGSLIFAVYIDDNLLTNNDPAGIKKAKAYLKAQFVTKEMGRPRYFIGIEISRSTQGVALSQRKYALNLPQENGLLGCKPVRTPKNANTELWDKSGLSLRMLLSRGDWWVSSFISLLLDLLLLMLLA